MGKSGGAARAPMSVAERRGSSGERKASGTFAKEEGLVGQGGVQYSGKHGIVRVTSLGGGDGGYAVEHYLTREHLRYNAGETTYVATAAEVNKRLHSIGYANTYDHGISKFNIGAPSKSKKETNGAGGAKTAKAKQKATPLSRGADWENARPVGAVGRYEVGVGDRNITVTRMPGGAFEVSDENRLTHRTSSTTLRTAAEVHDYIVSRGGKSAFAREMVRMAEHDVQRYVEQRPTPAMRARIAATDRRRAALDAKYGQFTEDAAKAQTRALFAKTPGLEEAIYDHLFGGSYLSPESMHAAIREEGGHPPSLPVLRSSLQSLNEISEWSLLHAPNVTREGTIRLWHGANGQTSPEGWKARLASTGTAALRATPFTTEWRVAASFAVAGPHGSLVISAHVPVSSVLVWYGISNSQSWGDEEEYTVRRGGMSDVEVLRLPS